MELSAMGSMQRSKVDYSPMEAKLLELLPKRGKYISINDLVDQYYDDPKLRPYTARQSVTSVMSALTKKVEYNQEPFKVVRQRLAGKPMEYARADR